MLPTCYPHVVTICYLYTVFFAVLPTFFSGFGRSSYVNTLGVKDYKKNGLWDLNGNFLYFSRSKYRQTGLPGQNVATTKSGRLRLVLVVDRSCVRSTTPIVGRRCRGTRRNPKSLSVITKRPVFMNGFAAMLGVRDREVPIGFQL